VKKQRVDRRNFIKGMATSAAMLSTLPQASFALNSGGSLTYDSVQQTEEPPKGPYRLKFAVVGTNHPHIYGMVAAALRGGGELVLLHETEPELIAAFKKQYPDVKMARSEAEVLEDPSIKLVLSSIIPDERAPLGIRVMKHGKDYMVDKPGITTLEQLAEARRVQAETKRIYSIDYSERFENKATIRAAELARAGAIGKVVQTVGVGPHRMSLNARPPWFFDKKRYGGIICDIGSHQADQFLYFTNSDKAEVVASQIGNVNHPQYPNFEDFGDLMLRGDGGAGYIRVDWFTPDGLSSWGDGRLTILGTDGFMEVRKNVDIAGKGNGSHLFLVDQKETRYIDTTNQPLLYGKRLIDDVLNRTDTAMSQAHCFLAMELVLKAQAQAQRVSFKA
jgi:predicted dehydrogenase